MQGRIRFASAIRFRGPRAGLGLKLVPHFTHEILKLEDSAVVKFFSSVIDMYYVAGLKKGRTNG